MLILALSAILCQVTTVSLSHSLTAKTFYIYKDPKKESWNNARTICEKAGGRLAMIDNRATQHALFAYSTNPDEVWKKNMNNDFWIGLNKKATETTRFRWDHCEPVDSDSLEDYWRDDEPQNPTESHCVCGDKNSLQWRTDGCKNEKQFLCETNDGPCEYTKGHGTCPSAEVKPLYPGLTVSKCEEKCSTEIIDGLICWMYSLENNECTLYFDRDPDKCSLSPGSPIAGLRSCFKYEVRQTSGKLKNELLYPDIECSLYTTTIPPPTTPTTTESTTTTTSTATTTSTTATNTYAATTTTSITTPLITITSTPSPTTTFTTFQAQTASPSSATTPKTTHTTTATPTSKSTIYSTTMATRFFAPTTTTFTTSPAPAISTSTYASPTPTTTHTKTASPTSASTIYSITMTTTALTPTVTTFMQTTTSPSTPTSTRPITITTIASTSIPTTTTHTSETRTTTNSVPSTTLTSAAPTATQTATSKSRTASFTTPNGVTPISESMTPSSTLSSTPHAAATSRIPSPSTSSLTASTSVTTTTTTAITESTVRPSNDTCPCFLCLQVKGQEAMQKLVDYLLELLRLDKSTLSSTRRKLESAQDDRPSAKALGITGILVIISVFAVFVIIDLMRFCKYLDERKKPKTRGSTSSPMN